MQYSDAFDWGKPLLNLVVLLVRQLHVGFVYLLIAMTSSLQVCRQLLARQMYPSIYVLYVVLKQIIQVCRQLLAYDWWQRTAGLYVVFHATRCEHVGLSVDCHRLHTAVEVILVGLHRNGPNSTCKYHKALVRTCS